MPIKPQLIDESGDRKYFTIIPNYILNHSSVYEQGVYVVMKRIAGEGGSCFASQKTIANKLGVSQPTASRAIKGLVKRGWIIQEGFQAGKTRPVKRWRIIDLWQLNSDYYNSLNKKIDKPQNISFKKDSETTEYKIDKPQNIEEEPKEEDKNKDIVTNVTKEFGNSSLNKGMELLTSLLGEKPSREKLNRYALKRLIAKRGEERTLKAITFALEQRDEKYCPMVCGYIDLEKKWEALETFARRAVKNRGAIYVD